MAAPIEWQDQAEGWKWRVSQGDCKDVLRLLPADSVDAIVTDPPYGLSPDGISRTTDDIDACRVKGGFRGHEWDSAVPGGSIWRECFRVLKPGGHLLAFCGTRTYHRMVCAVEDSGFRIRDMLGWCYIQGVGKGYDVSKGFDKAAGKDEERGYIPVRGGIGSGGSREVIKFRGTKQGFYLDPDNPITDDAKRWHGWNTALKPAIEPIVMARKPFSGTLLENLQQHGVGALNVDGCSVSRPAQGPGSVVAAPRPQPSLFGDDAAGPGPGEAAPPPPPTPETYWPANILVDPGAAEYLDGLFGEPWTRIFYCPKPTESERDAGLADLVAPAGTVRGAGGFHMTAGVEQGKNFHSTVKPIALMRWMVRLITPPGGLVLDPFAGSGSTGPAAREEGCRVHLVEREADYVPIILGRMKHAGVQGSIF